MEFGTSARLPCGGNIIGVSWTSPSSTPMADATQLITTSHTRIQIHAADDQRVIASWLTRPGASNRFVVAAVQHRASRQIFVVQDGNRLLAWHERQTALEAAATVTVRKDVYALRVSKHAAAVLVIYRDGSVSVYSLKLDELYYAAAGSSGGVPDKSLGKAKDHQKAATSASLTPMATWSRLTSTPSESGKLVLMVAVEIPASADAAPSTLLRVFTIVSGAGAAFTFAHQASHTLQPPDGATSTCRASTFTLHKHFQALTVIWSNGDLQVLRFQRAAGVHAGQQWYSVPPQVILGRNLGTHVPGAQSSMPPTSTLYCAGFALEPSCLVLAGAGCDAAGVPKVFMTVWDVRYGVILGAKDVAVEDGEDALGDRDQETTSSSTRPTKRQRSASASSATSGPSQSVFQVTVNEDGSYVACVSRDGVYVTPVAVRGASLASALGRLPATLSITRGQSYSASSHSVPVMSLRSMMHDAVVAAGGDGTLTATSYTRLSGIVSAAADRLSSDASAILDARVRTPSLHHIAAILSRYGVDIAPAALAAAPSVSTAVFDAAAPGTKRKRQSLVPEVSATALSAPPLPSTVAHTLPHALAAACVQRAVQELRCNASAGVWAPLLSALVSARSIAVSAHPDLIPELLSASAFPPTYRERKEENKAGAIPDPASVHALSILCDLLLRCVDVPESSLMDIFTCCLHRVSRPTLAALWDRNVRSGGVQQQLEAGVGAGAAAGSATSAPPSITNRHVIGLLYVTGLIVRAPRNDVFQEAALTALEPQDVRTMLACLLRLLQTHASAFVHARPVLSVQALDAVIEAAGGAKGKREGKGRSKERRAGAEDTKGLPRASLALLPHPGKHLHKQLSLSSAGASSVSGSADFTLVAPLVSHLPSYGQVLDWLRMTLDAHFARIVLMAKSDENVTGAGKGASLHSLLLEVARIVREQAALSTIAAPMRGYVEHMLMRLPLPAEPEADYALTVLRV